MGEIQRGRKENIRELGRDKIAQLRAVFDFIDLDNDGRITVSVQVFNISSFIFKTYVPVSVLLSY